MKNNNNFIIKVNKAVSMNSAEFQNMNDMVFTTQAIIKTLSCQLVLLQKTEQKYMVTYWQTLISEYEHALDEILTHEQFENELPVRSNELESLLEYDITNNVVFLDNQIIPMDNVETILDMHFLTQMQRRLLERINTNTDKLLELEKVLENKVTCM